MFNQKDLQQIRSKGISIDDINQQIKHFQHGFPPADITIHAMPGKGIMQLAEGDQQHFINIYLDNIILCHRNSGDPYQDKKESPRCWDY